MAKSERLEMRLTSEQKDLIERAARIKGLDVTSFVVPLAVDVAREVVGREAATLLSPRDFRRLMRILDSDVHPAPRLKAAVGRLLKLGGRER